MRKSFKLRLKSNCHGNMGDETFAEIHALESERSGVSTSLARQRSMEDDEEFEKARRRRDRVSNSMPDNEDISEEQHTSENSSAFNEEEETPSPNLEDDTVAFAEMLRKREEDKRQFQRETLQSLKLAKFASETDGEKESTSNQANENQKPEMKGAPTEPLKKKSGEDSSDKINAIIVKEKEITNSVASLQNHPGEENTCSQTPPQSPLSPIHTTRAFISLGKPKEVKSPTRLKTQLSLENNKCYPEAKSSTRVANDCFKSQARTEPKVSERGEHEKIGQEPFKRGSSKAGATDVKVTSAVATGIQSQKKENNADGPSSNDVPFHRFSSRATSFRVPNPEVKKQSFQRSASLRISPRSSSTKIDGILEKYAMAIQRSDSVKTKKCPPNYLTRPLEGIASKRCVFEKDDAQSVSSRHFISKKGIRPGDVANKRNLWESKADSVEKMICQNEKGDHSSPN
ncbi:ladinin-1-like isoform X1 [Scyliorhinus canicula]|uniref:ladinin-1-like isoform X1 n=1 Tax=Scyliorhinus canicula TaxID=7830 RepID=UPI0018F74569|nr:ladinin-1-like isoform X1 [Scyliorhinus canicula]